MINNESKDIKDLSDDELLKYHNTYFTLILSNPNGPYEMMRQDMISAAGRELEKRGYRFSFKIMGYKKDFKNENNS